ncbi:MAG: hypothetical protein FWB78_05475 [Treponema sp.]|nr:hypothetical protein [Treponema sp.]
MKRIWNIVILGIVSVVFVTGCASSANDAPQEGPSFIGSGCRGMRLGILVPESVNMDGNWSYLPSMVQGVLVSNISRYSAIDVLDRVSLDRMISETLDPTYEDNLDIVRLGHVAHVAYMMTGSITRTSAGYMLQLNVTDTTPNATTIASYSGLHPRERLDDLSAVNNASRELLQGMGVELTTAAIGRLNQAGTPQDIGSQTNLARGIVAQRRGTIVEALVHYHNAVSFDPGFSEATDRLSAHVSSGNLGEDVRNEIRWRNEWLRILAETEEFFNANLPFELAYSPSLEQGFIDFHNGRVELRTTVVSNPLQSSFDALSNVMLGLQATQRTAEWGVPRRWSPINRSSMIVKAVLLDANGNVISNAESTLTPHTHFTRVEDPMSSTLAAELVDFTQRWERESIRAHRLGDLDRSSRRWRQLEQEAASLEARAAALPPPSYILVADGDRATLDFIVNADDITDRLTIQIVSVNDTDLAQNPNFIRVTAR